MKYLSFRLCVAAVLLAGIAGAVEVKLDVEDHAGAARNAGIVTSGVPFAKGAVKDVSKLSARVGGKVMPAQFLQLAPWPDGSVRWALMDTQVDVPSGGKIALIVRDDGGNIAPPKPVKIENGSDAVKVSTGPLDFVVNKKKFNLFSSLKIDGKELVRSSGKGLVLYTESGKEVVAGPPTEVKIEQADPMRAIVCVKGKFPGVHENLLGYTVRITAFAGRKFVKVHVWLENGGAYGYARKKDKVKREPEWFAFDGMAVELGLGLGEKVSAACEGVKAAGKLILAQRCLGKIEHMMYMWKGKPRRGKLAQCGFTWNDFEYKITADGKELKKGARTDGVLALAGANGALTVAIRHFWQNYDKAIELNGSLLKFWLWPRDGAWPRDRTGIGSGLDTAVLMKRFAKAGVYQLPGSVHKGAEIILDFSGAPAGRTGAELSTPLMARATPKYYAMTEAAPGWFAPADVKSDDEDLDFKFRGWNKLATNAIDPKGTSSIQYARRNGIAGKGHIAAFKPISWYGWMDFGDVFSPYGSRSLHYDWPELMLVNYLRMGDRRFFDMAVSMSRHRMDVDQCWSDRDPPEYGYLARPDGPNKWRYYGGHPLHLGARKQLPNPGHTWLSGVVLYYMLTGEPKALESCMRNYRGIKLACVEPIEKKPGDWWSTTASSLSILNLCSLYDLTADKKYLKDALSLFSNHIARQWKSKGPYLTGEGGNSRSAETRAKAYCYGIPALCRLHELTADKQVMKMLTEGCEKEFPDTVFSDASRYLADLYAYVGYRVKNEDYIERAFEAFIEGFPEEQSPRCFFNDNEWSRRAALMLRTGHILQYVTWKEQR